jgi:S1-C subfamily serine protease
VLLRRGEPHAAGAGGIVIIAGLACAIDGLCVDVFAATGDPQQASPIVPPNERDPASAYTPDGRYIGPRDPNNTYTLDGVLVGRNHYTELTKAESHVSFIGPDPVVKRVRNELPDRWREVLTLSNGFVLNYGKLYAGGFALTHNDEEALRAVARETWLKSHGFAFDASNLRHSNGVTYQMQTTMPNNLHCISWWHVFGAQLANSHGDEEFSGRFCGAEPGWTLESVEKAAVDIFTRVRLDGHALNGEAKDKPAQPPPPAIDRSGRPEIAKTGMARQPQNDINASGFAITTQHIVTNFHVVAGCREVRFTLGKQHGIATIVAADREADIAILRVPFTMKSTVTFRNDEARIGEAVVVAGFPEIGALSDNGIITTGIVSAIGTADNQDVIQITAPVYNGNSGGPVFDGSGNVIGVTVGRIEKFRNETVQNVSFAVRAALVLKMMEGLGLKPQREVSVLEMAVPDISAEALIESGIVTCVRKH